MVLSWKFQKKTTRESYDYTLLVLEDQVSGYAGSYGIKSHIKYELENKQAYVNGYSGYTPGPTAMEHSQTASYKGPISVDNFKNLINYEIDTAEGRSVVWGRWQAL